MRRAAIAISMVLSVAPSVALAQRSTLGLASVSIGYERPFGARPERSMRDHGFVEIRIGGLYGGTLAYAAAVSVAVGGALDGGFVSRDELFPLGVGLRVGDLGYLALLGGVGVDAASAIGAALRLPVELRVELDLADEVRLLMASRLAWLFGHDVLDAGARDLDGIDEGEVMLGVRIGSRTSRGSSGYYGAVTASERQGARYLGVLVGVAVSAGGS